MFIDKVKIYIQAGKGGDGSQRKVRSVCRIGIDAQRNLHRPFHPYDFTNVRVDLTNFFLTVRHTFAQKSRRFMKNTDSNRIVSYRKTVVTTPICQ